MDANNKVLATRGQKAAKQMEFINQKIKEKNPALTVNNSKVLGWLINSYFNYLERTKPTKIDVNEMF